MPNQFNIDAAIIHAKMNAHASTQHKCAKYTRQAINAGGIDIGNTALAKNYGWNLRNAGFEEVHTVLYRKGDIVVIQGLNTTHPGHMAIFDGFIWISDYKQTGRGTKVYPGQAYDEIKPSYKIYRWPQGD